MKCLREGRVTFSRLASESSAERLKATSRVPPSLAIAVPLLLHPTPPSQSKRALLSYVDANRDVRPVVAPVRDIGVRTDLKLAFYRRVLVGGKGHSRWRSLLELLSSAGVDRQSEGVLIYRSNLSGN